MEGMQNRGFHLFWLSGGSVPGGHWQEGALKPRFPSPPLGESGLCRPPKPPSVSWSGAWRTWRSTYITWRVRAEEGGKGEGGGYWGVWGGEGAS